MRSSLAKVLHPVAGQPMLERVIRAAQALNPDQIYVVHGNGSDQVQQQMAGLPVSWVHQAEQLGTGHAVLQALPEISPGQRVLVMTADVPLISRATLQHLLDDVPQDAVGVLVAKVKNPNGLGRIIRNDNGDIDAIVEHKDADEQQRTIDEINSGILLLSAADLARWLPALSNKNSQGEYYLTDVIHMAVAEGKRVVGVVTHDEDEVLGINDRSQLAHAERRFQQRQAQQLMLGGVTIADPARIDIRGDVTVEPDVFLDINVVLSGKTSIKTGSTIGPQVQLHNVQVGNDVTIAAHSVLEDCVLEDGCTVGPFARIRPGTVLAAGSKVGNFVELKNCQLGAHSKVNHLSYLGDTEVGASVNVGAGTITCNYDGANKHKTVIKENAFIGSNSALIAPVTIGAGATIGAGSVISDDAPDQQLTLTRAQQQTRPDWVRPTKSEKEKAK